MQLKTLFTLTETAIYARLEVFLKQDWRRKLRRWKRYDPFRGRNAFKHQIATIVQNKEI